MSEIDSDVSDDDGDELEALLGDAMRASDMVPPWLTRFARESQRLISFDGELAAIVADTLVDGNAGTRSSREARTIEFATDTATITLGVEVDRIRGSIIPLPDDLLVVGEGVEPVKVEFNARGFFVFNAPGGPMQLRASFARRVVQTDWIILR